MELLFTPWHIPCLGRLMDKWRTLRPHRYKESGSPTCGGIMVLMALVMLREFLHEQGLGLKDCDLIGKR